MMLLPILASRGEPMNLTRIALASIAAFIAYFAVGGLVFGLLPWMKNEFLRYPTIYRSQEGIKSTMPIGMAFMFLAIVVLAVLYAMLYQGGSGVTEGARFGALIGVFAIGSFVVHNYVNLQIGIRLTVLQGIAYFVEWVIVGLVIGLIYRPAH
jgi:archaellum biogenesis protein FlaJ (TadC family)